MVYILHIIFAELFQSAFSVVLPVFSEEGGFCKLPIHINYVVINVYVRGRFIVRNADDSRDIKLDYNRGSVFVVKLYFYIKVDFRRIEQY